MGNRPLLSALAVAFLAGACFLGRLTYNNPIKPGPFLWRELDYGLPPSVQIFEGVAQGPEGEPFRAWFAAIDYADRNLKAYPLLASTPGGRELPSLQARQAKALIAVNGGYFDVVQHPAKTYSLIVQNGKVLRENLNEITRGGRRYFTARSAFGITKDRRFEIGWAFHDGGLLWRLPHPVSELLRAGKRKPELSNGKYSARREWKQLESAIGGGPRLIQEGKVFIPFEDEVFFNSGFPWEENYARTAIGWRDDNRLILFVVDGARANHSVGLTLTQLAEVLLELGCAEAMNLDGGGSSAFVVNGVLLNRPSDGRERATTSSFAVVRTEKTEE